MGKCFVIQSSGNGKASSSSHEISISLKNENYPQIFISLFCCSLFWCWHTITSNLRDLNPSDLTGFKFGDDILESEILMSLSAEHIKNLNENSSMLTRIQKGKGETITQSFKISNYKPAIDEIDKVLARHYGFTDEELDYIINCDIKYRMGGELGEV